VEQRGPHDDLSALRVGWHLTPTATTAVFALYPIVLVVFLLVFGQISDHIGRRATMLKDQASRRCG